MRLRAEQSPLQVITKTRIDGKSNNQSGDTGPNADDGDESDERDDGLFALGLEIANGYDYFEFRRIKPSFCPQMRKQNHISDRR